MCGILGFYNLISQRNTVGWNVHNDIKKLSLRGRDGYGYFGYNSNHDMSIQKREVSIEAVSFPNFSKLMIFNSRAVPTTEWETGAGRDIINQQPFDDERFVVVHNGIIANDKELIKEYNLNPKSKVDSAILPCLFSKVGVVSGLRKLKGSYAILCYDKLTTKFYAAKNFMPLRIFTNTKSFIFVSLEEMLEDLETKEVEPYTCYEIALKEDGYDMEIHSLYPRQRNKKVLVICSGGIDSVTDRKSVV